MTLETAARPVVPCTWPWHLAPQKRKMFHPFPGGSTLHFSPGCDAGNAGSHWNPPPAGAAGATPGGELTEQELDTDILLLKLYAMGLCTSEAGDDTVLSSFTAAAHRLPCLERGRHSQDGQGGQLDKLLGAGPLRSQPREKNTESTEWESKATAQHPCLTDTAHGGQR